MLENTSDISDYATLLQLLHFSTEDTNTDTKRTPVGRKHRISTESGSCSVKYLFKIGVGKVEQHVIFKYCGDGTFIDRRGFIGEHLATVLVLKKNGVSIQFSECVMETLSEEDTRNRTCGHPLPKKSDFKNLRNISFLFWIAIGQSKAISQKSVIRFLILVRKTWVFV